MTQPLYRLRVSDEIADLLKSLHPHLKKKVKASMKEILADPFTGKALKNELDGLRSFRISTFRIIYRIAPTHIIEIVAIGPRKYIYKETFRLLNRQP